MSFKSTFIIFSFFFFANFYGQNNEVDNNVGHSLSFQSEIMNDEREIQIFLPDSYTNSDIKYPVLYVLDGQRYFLHGVSVQKSFVEFKQTPEFIIVGISKVQSDRNRNFSVNSKKYLEFLKTEVINYVDTKYRASKKRMLFGWAYGGGFTIEAMITDPNLFDAYIAASPFPLEERTNKIDSLFKENRNLNKLLYFTSGTNEGVVRQGTKDLNTLLSNNISKAANWTFRELEGEEHRSTPFITLYHGIKKYFNYYSELQFNNLEEFLNAGGIDYVYDYYQKRAEKYDFPKELSDWTMFSIARNAIRANNFKMFDTLVDEFKTTEFLCRLRESRASAIKEFYVKNNQSDKANILFNDCN